MDKKFTICRQAKTKKSFKPKTELDQKLTFPIRVVSQVRYQPKLCIAIFKGTKQAMTGNKRPNRLSLKIDFRLSKKARLKVLKHVPVTFFETAESKQQFYYTNHHYSYPRSRPRIRSNF